LRKLQKFPDASQEEEASAAAAAAAEATQQEHRVLKTLKKQNAFAISDQRLKQAKF
jgi:hypothetical protein